MKVRKIKKIPKKIFVVLSLVILVIGTLIVVLLSQTRQPLQGQANSFSEQTSKVIPCSQNPISEKSIFFSCAGYSLRLSKEWHVTNYELIPEQLPKGWLQSGKIANAEYANYDESNAAGRSYNPTLDKGLQKFGAYTFNTTKDLQTLATEYTTTLQQKIISITGVTVNSYSGIKVYARHPMGQNVNIYLIKDISSDKVAVIGPIFGFSDSNEDFQNQILSKFKFLNK
jgi:hypothetical protein